MQPRRIFIFLVIPLLLAGCLRGVRPAVATALPAQTAAAPVSTETQPAPAATSTIPAAIPTATIAVISTVPSAYPSVTISAVKGNVFIRRGPGMAYNPIDVLYKDTSAPVIGRDVLSRWVQVVIPGSDKMGWVFINSGFAQLDGDLASVPDFTPTDWPVPGYLINCTHHDMYIMPGEIIIPASFGDPANEAWLYPGFYTIQDISMLGEPKIQDIEMREGVDIEIRVDGTGEGRKCP